MIARYTLILTMPEAVQRLSVDRGYDFRDILASVIDGARDLVRCGNGSDSESRRRNHESLIDKDLRPDRVVHRHERQIIVVVDLP